MPRHRAAWSSGHSARILQHRAFPCRSIAGEGGMWWSVAWAGAVTLSRVRGGPSVWQCCLPPSPARTYPGTAVPEKRTHPAPPLPPPEGRHLPGCDVKKHPYDVPGGCHGNSVMSQRSESLRVDGRGVEGGGGEENKKNAPQLPPPNPERPRGAEIRVCLPSGTEHRRLGTRRACVRRSLPGSVPRGSPVPAPRRRLG